MRYACEVNRTLRQERSMILAEIAHLDIDEAVAVLISAMNERALEREMVSEVRFRPLVFIREDEGTDRTGRVKPKGGCPEKIFSGQPE